jgi:hypothetical protein
MLGKDAVGVFLAVANLEREDAVFLGKGAGEGIQHFIEFGVSDGPRRSGGEPPQIGHVGDVFADFLRGLSDRGGDNLGELFGGFASSIGGGFAGVRCSHKCNPLGPARASRSVFTNKCGMLAPND